MPLYVKGTDIKIVGTLENMHAVAHATGFDPDGMPGWTGKVTADMQSQNTVYRDDQRVWVDENGDTHLEDRIEERR